MASFLSVISRTFLANQLYGWKYAPHIGTFSEPYVYVKAMLFTAGADRLDHVERAYIQGLVENLFPESDSEISNFVEHFPATQSSLSVANFLSGAIIGSPVFARILLYDSVRAAISDEEFSKNERASVFKVAKQLGVGEKTTHEIERLVLKEAEISDRKRSLLLSGKKVPGPPYRSYAVDLSNKRKL